MQADWKEEAVEQAVQKIVPALTISMTPSNVVEARKTYQFLFRHDLDDLGELNRGMATSIFSERLTEKLAQIAPLSLEDRKKLLQEDTFVAQVLSVDDFVQHTAENVLRGEPVTPETRTKILGARDQLNQMAAALKNSPDLQGRVGMRISESLLDCRFLLEGGEPTSLRLHKYNEYLKLQKTP